MPQGILPYNPVADWVVCSNGTFKNLVDNQILTSPRPYSVIVREGVRYVEVSPYKMGVVKNPYGRGYLSTFGRQNDVYIQWAGIGPEGSMHLGERPHGLYKNSRGIKIESGADPVYIWSLGTGSQVGILAHVWKDDGTAVTKNDIDWFIAPSETSSANYPNYVGNYNTTNFYLLPNMKVNGKQVYKMSFESVDRSGNLLTGWCVKPNKQINIDIVWFCGNSDSYFPHGNPCPRVVHGGGESSTLYSPTIIPTTGWNPSAGTLIGSNIKDPFVGYDEYQHYLYLSYGGTGFTFSSWPRFTYTTIASGKDLLHSHALVAGLNVDVATYKVDGNIILYKNGGEIARKALAGPATTTMPTGKSYGPPSAINCYTGGLSVYDKELTLEEVVVVTNFLKNGRFGPHKRFNKRKC
jgi:hypothetical protein